MGGDATLWRGMWTQTAREMEGGALRFMADAFGVDSPYPTMVQQWYREKYAELYDKVRKEVSNADAEADAELRQGGRTPTKVAAYGCQP